MVGQNTAWQRGILRWRYLVIALLVLSLAFVLVMRGVRKDRATILEAQSQSSRELLLTQENYDALTVRLAQVGSSGYIENIARQNYSFVRKNEKRFEITNPEFLDGYTYEELQILQEERKYY